MNNHQEGDECPSCHEGVLTPVDAECTCHCTPMPPCYNCENVTLECTSCGDNFDGY